MGDLVNSSFWHLGAYWESQPGSTTLGILNPVQDNVLTLLSNGFVVPDNAELIGAYGGGAAGGLTAVQIDNPQLRYIGLPKLAFLNGTITVPSVPNFNNYSDQPFAIDRINTTAVRTNNADAGAQNQGVGLWFRFGRRSNYVGPRYTLRGTTSITGVTGSWASGSITMDDTLPQGVYEIQGMDVVAANVLFARLIINGPKYRPGVVARESVNNQPVWCYQHGGWGPMGRFASINLPNLEILASGATTSQQVFLELVRIGDLG